MDNVTTDMLDRLEAAEIADLPPGVLNDLHWKLAQDAVTLKQREAKLHGGFEHRYALRAAEVRLTQGKDTGVVHLDDGEYDVTISAPKRVEWNQDELRRCLDLMEPDEARHYAKVSLAVEERKFDAATPYIRQLLSSARTVKVGKTTYALGPKKDLAA